MKPYHVGSEPGLPHRKMVNAGESTGKILAAAERLLATGVLLFRSEARAAPIVHTIQGNRLDEILP